jgi:hypothetical protein
MLRVLAVLLILIGAMYWYLRPAPAVPVAPAPPAVQPEKKAIAISEKKTQPIAIPAKPQLPFSREGVAAKIVQEVERVARPKAANVALLSSDDARLVVVVVDAPERAFAMDPGLQAQYLTIIEAQGFHEPPGPMAMTMSRYASVAKTAMNFDAAKGDHMMVLQCPEAEWQKIDLPGPK